VSAADRKQTSTVLASIGCTATVAGNLTAGRWDASHEQLKDAGQRRKSMRDGRYTDVRAVRELSPPRTIGARLDRMVISGELHLGPVLSE
jgi:hypothetical protein